LNKTFVLPVATHMLQSFRIDIEIAIIDIVITIAMDWTKLYVE